MESTKWTQEAQKWLHASNPISQHKIIIKIHCRHQEHKNLNTIRYYLFPRNINTNTRTLYSWQPHINYKWYNQILFVSKKHKYQHPNCILLTTSYELQKNTTCTTINKNINIRQIEKIKQNNICFTSIQLSKEN